METRCLGIHTHKKNSGPLFSWAEKKNIRTTNIGIRICTLYTTTTTKKYKKSVSTAHLDCKAGDNQNKTKRKEKMQKLERHWRLYALAVLWVMRHLRMRHLKYFFTFFLLVQQISKTKTKWRRYFPLDNQGLSRLLICNFYTFKVKL